MRLESGDQATPKVNWSFPGSTQRRCVPSGHISQAPRPAPTAIHAPSGDHVANDAPPNGNDVTLRTSLPSIPAVHTSPSRTNANRESSWAHVIGAGKLPIDSSPVPSVPPMSSSPSALETAIVRPSGDHEAEPGISWRLEPSRRRRYERAPETASHPPSGDHPTPSSPVGPTTSKVGSPLVERIERYPSRMKA